MEVLRHGGRIRIKNTIKNLHNEGFKCAQCGNICIIFTRCAQNQGKQLVDIEKYIFKD